MGSFYHARRRAASRSWGAKRETSHLASERRWTYPSSRPLLGLLRSSTEHKEESTDLELARTGRSWVPPSMVAPGPVPCRAWAIREFFRE